MQAIDDLALLREYASNNSEAAFEALVSRYVRLVYSAALRQTCDASLAEEITQAVFIILAKKASRMSGRTILSGWFFKTTRFVAMAQSRAAARRRQFEQELHMQAEGHSDPADPCWEQIAPLLDEALMRLGEKDRQALLMRYFENKGLAEIGRACGSGEDAARMRINRALEKLHRYFRRRGISTTLALLGGALSTNSAQAVPMALAKSVSAVAFAKGTAASGLTLDLIEGAVKAMAWTKAKSALLVGAAVFIIGSAGIFSLEFFRAIREARYPNIQGAWEGVVLLEEDGVTAGEPSRTHVVLKLVKTNGVYAATTDWIEMGRKDVPMGRVVYEYPSLRIERSLRDTWKLTVNSDATQMRWDHAIHFIQPDPVLLTRTSSPDPVPERLAESEFAPRVGSDLQGYWKGAINTDSGALPVHLKIAEPTAGVFRAEGDDPMQGINGRPVSVVYNRPKVRLEVSTGTGAFEGEIDNANTMMSGFWIQGGQSTPAILKRADYQSEQAQSGVRDYSFDSLNDLPGHWKGSWVVTIAKTKATIRFALDIGKLADGSYSATLANIDEFGYDAPVPASDFEYDPPNLRLNWEWAGTRYDGRLVKGKLVGTWFQGGGGFPLVFERSLLK